MTTKGLGPLSVNARQPETAASAPRTEDAIKARLAAIAQTVAALRADIVGRESHVALPSEVLGVLDALGQFSVVCADLAAEVGRVGRNRW